MSKKKVSVDQLSAEFTKIISDYTDEKAEEVKSAVKDVSKSCLNEIKQNSPRLTGDYKKGWRRRTAFESRQDLRVEIYNKTNYQLTHLLEFGHVIKNGTHREYGTVSGRPHIRPAEQRAEQELEKRIKAVLSK
jgi:hypothetical protein